MDGKENSANAEGDAGGLQAKAAAAQRATASADKARAAPRARGAQG